MWDVCSLGSCSRFWEEICGVDFVWECLSRERWPDIDLDKEFLAYENQRLELGQSIHPINKVSDSPKSQLCSFCIFLCSIQKSMRDSAVPLYIYIYVGRQVNCFHIIRSVKEQKKKEKMTE